MGAETSGESNTRARGAWKSVVLLVEVSGRVSSAGVTSTPDANMASSHTTLIIHCPQTQISSERGFATSLTLSEFQARLEQLVFGAVPGLHLRGEAGIVRLHLPQGEVEVGQVVIRGELRPHGRAEVVGSARGASRSRTKSWKVACAPEPMSTGLSHVTASLYRVQ